MHSISDIIAAFMAAMREAGIEPPPDISADGVLHRFHVPGHKSGTLNGAYKLHIDGVKPAGYFEDFKSGIKQNWKADGSAKPLNQDQRRALETARQQRQQKQLERHQKAADIAQRLLTIAKPSAVNDHPYLQRKQVQSHGLYQLKLWPKRVMNAQGQWESVTVREVLLVPLTDIDGRLWNVQAIFTETHPILGRDKDFLAGGRLGGLFHRIGSAGNDPIICEGYATGATLHEATGQPVYCAMSAGNLLAVAQAVRHAQPHAQIIIAADNDTQTEGNPGLTAASHAAGVIGGYLVVPPIAGDFNDYANMEGSV